MGAAAGSADRMMSQVLAALPSAIILKKLPLPAGSDIKGCLDLTTKREYSDSKVRHLPGHRWPERELPAG
jgi:hypothetical protein